VKAIVKKATRKTKTWVDAVSSKRNFEWCWLKMGTVGSSCEGIMNVQVLKHAGKFLSRCTIGSNLRRTELHGVN
jgi:hypothetical protein